ncbi:MAG: T9SS type A sorting domain-containing protein [Bacteroidota bacterium]|nr:T9SS type A sorting domain-containing protein [Bacteroidota bacterium]
MLNRNQFPDYYHINRLDSVGDVIFSKVLTDSLYSPIIFSLLLSNDSNFVTGCFYQELSTSIRSLFIVKFDQLGDTLWRKVIQPDPGFEFFGRYFIETSDHGFLFTGAYVDLGWVNSEVFILKTDSIGNILWTNTFGGSAYDDAFSTVETPDKGFLTLGLTRSFGFGNSWNRDDLLVKWDSLGNYQWHKTYGTPAEDIGVGITKCMDGNYLLGSGKYVNSNFSQGKIIKIDVDGNIIWQKVTGNRSDSFWWAREKSNYDIVAIGSERNSNNFDNGFIFCTDSAGNEKWRRQYRYGNDHCYFRDVQETPDGGIVCAGFVFDGASGNQDGWLVKLDSNGCLSAVNCGQPTGLLDVVASSSYDISIAPNPVVDQAIIKVDGLPQHLLQEHYQVTIFDITGKKILSPVYGYLISETGIQFIFKRETLKSGIYLLELATTKGERIGTLKVLIQ